MNIIIILGGIITHLATLTSINNAQLNSASNANSTGLLFLKSGCSLYVLKPKTFLS